MNQPMHDPLVHMLEGHSPYISGNDLLDHIEASGYRLMPIGALWHRDGKRAALLTVDDADELEAAIDAEMKTSAGDDPPQFGAAVIARLIAARGARS